MARKTRAGRCVLVGLVACVAALVGALAPAGVTPVGAVGPNAISIDCDTSTAGIQDTCAVGSATRDVGVVFTNTSASPVTIGPFNFRVNDPTTANVSPPVVVDADPSLNSNPDANQWAGMDCNPPAPDNDTGAGGAGTATSFLSCSGGSSASIPGGASLVLATVHYNVVGFGTTTLNLASVNVFSPSITELGSCNPTVTTAAVCVGATITPPAAFSCDNSTSCFTTTTVNLWHREMKAAVTGMTGVMLAFNKDCDGTGGVTGCTYFTAPPARVSGQATSHSFGPATAGTAVTFKTARETEVISCAAADWTAVLYSMNGGLSWSPLDLSAGSISAGTQTLGSGAAAGQICGNSLTAQTVQVPLPVGTTNISFYFDSVDDQFNAFAGWFVDDVVVRGTAGDSDLDGCPDAQEVANRALAKEPDDAGDPRDFPDADRSMPLKVNVTDFSLLLNAWNTTPANGSPPYDSRVNFDSSNARIQVGDFSVMLAAWNRKCVN